MIDYLFTTGVSHLTWLADLTHTTYQQINIIVYFIAIPIVWAVMLSMITSSINTAIGSIYTLVAAGALLDIRSFEQVYDIGVKIVEWFSIIGWDYYEASVYTCVHFPIIVTAILMILIVKKQ